MIKRGLYIGRFNPPHLGHIEAIKSIIDEGDLDQLIIGIGSAQESFTQDNPFTAGERFEMLLIALDEIIRQFSKIIIVPLVDLNNNNQWIPYIKSLLPKFKIIYSNNPLVQLLTIKDPDLEIVSLELINRDQFSSTNIRKKILLNDETWKRLVPESVSKKIIEIKGIERIRKLYTNDFMQK